MSSPQLSAQQAISQIENYIWSQINGSLQSLCSTLGVSTSLSFPSNAHTDAILTDAAANLVVAGYTATYSAGVLNISF